MTLKLWDFECAHCTIVIEYMIDVPMGERAADQIRLACPQCEQETWFRRHQVAKFAKYTGEGARRDFNPAVHGGRYDTMGSRQGGELPELPGVAEIEQKMCSEMEHGASYDDTVRKYQNDLPTTMDYKTLFGSAEWREKKAEKKALQAENALKKARATAIAKGEITMRDAPLPGDPKALHGRVTGKTVTQLASKSLSAK